MFYKTVIGGFVVSISTTSGTPITEEEYNKILRCIESKPDYECSLKDSTLRWNKNQSETFSTWEGFEE